MKRPRKVKVTFTKREAYVAEYDCPFCNTKYIGYAISKGITTRFICSCGNELIVEQDEGKRNENKM